MLLCSWNWEVIGFVEPCRYGWKCRLKNWLISRSICALMIHFGDERELRVYAHASCIIIKHEICQISYDLTTWRRSDYLVYKVHIWSVRWHCLSIPEICSVTWIQSGFSKNPSCCFRWYSFVEDDSEFVPWCARICIHVWITLPANASSRG